MYETDRPFGVKVIFIGLLLSGLVGIYAALFASDEFVREIILNDEILGIIGGFFNNIAFLRTALTIFSIFFLWLSSGVFSLKRSAWYFLLALTILPLIVYLIVLAVLHINNITLENIQKTGIAIRIIVDICWLVYICAVQDYFVED